MERLNKVLNVILEDLESKLPRVIQTLTGRKSRWRGRHASDEYVEKFARAMASYDPTPNKQYIQYLAQQVRDGNIELPEDGGHFYEMLEIFIGRQRDWTGGNDVFAYKNWRQLQRLALDYAGKREAQTTPVESKRASMKKFKSMAKEGTRTVYGAYMRKGDGRVKYELFEATNWAAVSLLGKGTTWCTSSSMYRDRRVTGPSSYSDIKHHVLKFMESDLVDTPWEGWTRRNFYDEIIRLNGWSSTDDFDGVREYKAPNSNFLNAKENAQNYLVGMPVYVLYKDDKPYIQIGFDPYDRTLEMRDVEDIELVIISPATARVFQGAINTGEMSRNFELLAGNMVKETLAKYEKKTPSNMP